MGADVADGVDELLPGDLPVLVLIDAPEEIHHAGLLVVHPAHVFLPPDIEIKVCKLLQLEGNRQSAQKPQRSHRSPHLPPSPPHQPRGAARALPAQQDTQRRDSHTSPWTRDGASPRAAPATRTQTHTHCWDTELPAATPAPTPPPPPPHCALSQLGRNPQPCSTTDLSPSS